MTRPGIERPEVGIYKIYRKTCDLYGKACFIKKKLSNEINMALSL